MTDDRIEVDKMILEIGICPREGVWWTVFMKVVSCRPVEREGLVWRGQCMYWYRMRYVA